MALVQIDVEGLYLGALPLEEDHRDSLVHWKATEKVEEYACHVVVRQGTFAEGERFQWEMVEEACPDLGTSP